MEQEYPIKSLIPLGDQAALAYLADEGTALRFAANVQGAGYQWLVDVVQAYTSVAVFFDLTMTNFAGVAGQLQQLATMSTHFAPGSLGHLHVIPCCYELALDLDRVMNHTGQARDDIIRLHTAVEYTVYAIGFCPGFPYLGYLPPQLCGVPRLAAPRLRVQAGSVGVTGRQTGIYTEERPGGWNLIGRTPLELVNVAEGYFPLRTGDRVRFEPIDEGEYSRLRGQRLDGEASRLG
jgi:inhibitor of KinA